MNKEINSEGIDCPAIEKRESARLAKKLSARIRNQTCAVLNVSKRGILLETSMPIYLFPVTQTIHLELAIEDHWMSINGIIKWVSSDQEYSRVGIFIKKAPELYLDYLKKLYS